MVVVLNMISDLSLVKFELVEVEEDRSRSLLLAELKLDIVFL